MLDGVEHVGLGRYGGSCGDTVKRKGMLIGSSSHGITGYKAQLFAFSKNDGS